MVEIALSLAIIGFALVAIIGILPAGMSVQRENREQDIINLDAAFLMDVIRNGAQGQDDLTNYVNKITISSQTFNSAGQSSGSASNIVYSNFTSGYNIVGLLSTPKYVPKFSFLLGGWGFVSNSVTVNLRAINGPAVDQGLSSTSRDFAFQYQVGVEIIPSAEYAYKSGTNTWGNMTSPNFANAIGGTPADSRVAQQLQSTMNEIRLSFRWPMLAPFDGTKFGGGRQVFRSSMAGTVTNVGPLYFIQPLAYQPTQ